MVNSVLVTILLVALAILFITLYLLERRDVQRLTQLVSEIQSKFHSTAVKHGQQWEHFVPFMDNYPGDREHSVFLGMPIDYLSFGKDQILFIEVKTGNSSLSERQRQIKELVEQKKVGWREVNYR